MKFGIFFTSILRLKCIHLKTIVPSIILIMDNSEIRQSILKIKWNYEDENLIIRGLTEYAA